MTPREFFDSLPTEMPEVNQRAKLIDEQYPDCVCEQESVSAHSTGPVDNTEFIFRYIFSPIHIESDGTVKAAAFSDVEDKGLSCDRNSAETAHPDLHERAIAQVEAFNRANPDKPKRSYLGSISSNCAEVRSLIHNASGQRAFAVYDTALENNVDHVDVFQTLRESPANRKLLRKQLRDKFLRKPVR